MSAERQCGAQPSPGTPAAAVRRHIMEALAQRMATQPEPVRRVLEGKLAKAMAEYREHLERAPQETPAPTRLEPEARSSPLADLLSHIERHAAQDFSDDGAEQGGDHIELKSLRYFRATWSRLSIDQAVTQALAAGPANAGPLNSHALMLRALQSMRDTAPDYLDRFMIYADALLWLDQANGSRMALRKHSGAGESRKKKPTKRGSSRRATD